MGFMDILAKTAGDIQSLKRGRDALVAEAIDLALSIHGERVLCCEGTDYGLPSVYAWRGPGPVRASDVPSIFMKGNETGIDNMLNLGTDASMAFDVLASIAGIDIVPDSWLDAFGMGLIKGTVPGIALFIGKPNSRSIDEVRECVSKGLIVILSDKYYDMELEGDNVLRLSGIEALGVNGLVSRVALRFGGAEPGNKTSVAKYLKKKPKLIVIHTGRLTILDVTIIFSAAVAGAFIVSDSLGFPSIPRLSENLYENMAAGAMAGRGIIFPKSGCIRSGSAFENERIRKADARLEFGGPDAPSSYEIAISSGEAEDGRVRIVGKDIQELEQGGHHLSVEVFFSGDVDPVMEQAVERRIHFALSRTEGVWHSGQRDNMWMRVGNVAVDKGLTFEELGHNIICDIKDNFAAVAESVEVKFSSDPSDVSSGISEARRRYEMRDFNIVGLTDQNVDSFYTCTICQSYAPGHICIISPERPSVCGSVTWTDARVGGELNPGGPQRPFPKGVLLDAEKGEWSGANEVVSKTSMGSIQRVCMHSVADSPMTTCSCMEVAVVLSADRRSIILLDRSDLGRNPSGYSFSDVSAIVGRGGQHPGFMGIGKHYILSGSFLRGDGGLERISWISSRLKSVLGEPLRKAFNVAGGAELYCKIADENVAEDAGSLERWLYEKEHPSIFMRPL
ncbi:MAG: hypothetical protein VB016_02540 [Methanomassiliicoccaceae archaeon]|nr:hypothetical protein [Methanomassiliicoccaceae archaeon]